MLARSPLAPLLAPTVGLAAGILFDDLAGRGIAVYLAGWLLAGSLFAWPLARRECLGLVALLAAFCCGGLLHDRQTRRLPADHVVRFTGDAPVLIRLRGTVVSEPHLLTAHPHPFSAWWPPAERTRFIIQASAVETVEGWRAVRGRVRVTVRAPLMDMVPGDQVEVFGSCFRPQPPDNPGQFDWAARDRGRGLFVALSCDHRECVRPLDRDSADPVWRAWWLLRQRARALLLGDMLDSGESEGTLLDTMLLGRRAAIDPQVNEAFQRTGLNHFLAVSGLNVGILAALFWGLGRAIGMGNRASAVLVIAAVLLFGWMTDPLPPIERATVMSVAVCLSTLLGRPRNFLNGLCLASIVILLISPAALFDVGFQLSFTALLGIVYGTPEILLGLRTIVRLAARLFGVHLPRDTERDLFVQPAKKAWWRRYVGNLAWGGGTAVAVSLAAWAATLPLILLHFGRVSPWGWLSTLMVAPLVGLVMAAGPAKLLAALVWPSLADWLIAPIQGLTLLLIRAVEWLATWPYCNLPTSTPPTWLAVLFYGAILAWFGRRRMRYGSPITLALASVAIMGSVVWLMPRGGDGRLTLTVLAVGRGTAVVLTMPDGKSLLYDAGSAGAYDPGRSVIVPYLRHRGIRGLHAVLISHANLDHFGGLPAVLDEIATGPVYLSPYFEPPSPEEEPGSALLEELRRRSHSIFLITRGQRPLQFGEANLEVLWPPSDLERSVAANETSLVVRIRYAGRSILMTGDIESLAQRRLLETGDLRADVLLLPHHGSIRGNPAEFVAAVGPDILLDSTATRRAEQEPAFRHMIDGRRYYDTADCGALTVTVDEQSVQVYTVRPCPPR